MNRKLLALAVGAALALPMTAQAAPKLYGILDVSVENLDGEQFDFVAPPTGLAGVEELTMETNKSRLGIRGEEALVGDLSVIYQVEYGITVDGDSANSTDLSARDRYLGVAHKQLGSLSLGRMDTPLKDAEGKVDQFGSSRLDMDNVFAGQVRASNSIAYTSPRLADAITARLTAITEEQANGAGFSASVAYDKDGLYLALAMDNNVTGEADSGTLNGVPAYVTYFQGPGPSIPVDLELDTTRLVAGFSNDQFSVGALYQQSEGQGPGVQPEQTGYLLSGAIHSGDLSFKLQYAASEGEIGAADLGEITLISAGLDYRVTQATKVYAMLGQYEYDSPATVFTTLGDADLTLVGVGMKYSF